MITLSDGISIAFQSDGLNLGNVEDYSKIRVDIDGPNKGKNQYGNDIFDFVIYSRPVNGDLLNQLMPYYLPGDYESDNSISSYETAWVIENGNLDYLKCPEELNWETKTSCE